MNTAPLPLAPRVDVDARPPDSSSAPPRWLVWVLGALLFAGTLALFSRTLGYDFLDYDDPDFVTANAHVRGGPTSAGLRWAFTSGGQAANWQPLSWLSLMLDARAYGVSAPGFHLTNVLLHSLNAVLAFLLLRQLLGGGWVSALGAAAFAWHPLRVESVAWISERKDVLSACFGLLTLCLYVAYARRRRAGGQRTGLIYTAALVCFTLGLLSKAMLVTLPAVMVLIDAWLAAYKPPAGRWRIAEKLPFCALAAGSCAVTYLVQRSGGALNPQFGWPHLAANALVSVPRYLAKSFHPVDLAVCYAHELSLPARTIVAAALVVAAITGLAVWQRRRVPGLLLGWLWFVGMLVPVLGLIPAGGQSMADRYTYLPSLGLVLALAAVLRASLVSRAWAGLGVVTATVAIAILAVMTSHQLGFWRDSTTLFEHALAVTERNYIAHTCRSTTLLNAGEFARAEAECRRALAINPRYAPAHFHLGAVLEAMGRADEARASYQRTLEAWPQFAPAHERLGYVLLHAGETRAALAEFEAAVALQPDAASVWLGIGLSEAAAGRDLPARTAYQAALRLDPASADAEHAYANLLAAHGEIERAWRRYEAALRARPRFPEAHFNYANSLAQLGQAQRAAAHYRAAVKLRPLEAEFHYGLASALERVESAQAAIAEYRETTRLQPTHAEAQFNLGRLLLDGGAAAKAETALRAAIAAAPDFALAYLTLGVAEAQLGRLDDALRDQQRAVALTPDHAESRYFFGETLRQAGRFDEAAEQWAAALRLKPDLPGLGAQLAALRREIASRQTR